MFTKTRSHGPTHVAEGQEPDDEWVGNALLPVGGRIKADAECRLNAGERIERKTIERDAVIPANVRNHGQPGRYALRVDILTACDDEARDVAAARMQQGHEKHRVTDPHQHRREERGVEPRFPLHRTDYRRSRRWL
jgi:hypothetical protein